MENKKRLGLVIGVGVADVLLIVILVLTVFMNDSFNSEVSPNVSADFEENATTYSDVSSTKEYTSNVKIAYGDGNTQTDGAGQAEEVETENTATNEYTDFIFPKSNTEQITKSEMKELLKDRTAVQRAINEIYSRHGYKFTSDENIEYFSQFEWYQNMQKESVEDKVISQFSVVEKTNVDNLRAYSVSQGWE